MELKLKEECLNRMQALGLSDTVISDFKDKETIYVSVYGKETESVRLKELASFPEYAGLVEDVFEDTGNTPYHGILTDSYIGRTLDMLYISELDDLEDEDDEWRLERRDPDGWIASTCIDVSSGDGYAEMGTVRVVSKDGGLQRIDFYDEDTQEMLAGGVSRQASLQLDLSFVSYGKPLGGFPVGQEMLLADINTDGLVYLYAVPKLSDAELEELRSEFEIRFSVYGGIIYLSLKFGRLSWATMPYSPHLSSDIEGLLHMANAMSGDKVMAMTAIAVDSDTGIVKNIRSSSIGGRFTEKLLKEIRKSLSRPFDLNEYKKATAQHLERYTDKEIASMAECYYKVR